MDKLRRFFSGDESPDEESGIIQQVKNIIKILSNHAIEGNTIFINLF